MVLLALARLLLSGRAADERLVSPLCGSVPNGGIERAVLFLADAALMRDFGHIADLLGARMGCFLFQLSPSFHSFFRQIGRAIDAPCNPELEAYEMRSFIQEALGPAIYSW